LKGKESLARSSGSCGGTCFRGETPRCGGASVETFRECLVGRRTQSDSLRMLGTNKELYVHNTGSGGANLT